MKLPKFLIGIFVGSALAAIFWYWQKSTSAEDGALDVLDRYAESEARVRDLETRLRRIVEESVEEADSPEQTSEIEESQEGDDLQQIAGIGPAYAQRLSDAGISTFAELAQQTPQRVMAISGARSEEAAAAWIDAAQQLSGS